MKSFLIAILVATTFSVGCTRQPPAQSVSGVKVAYVGKVETDEKGQTVEQRNIIDRIKADNDLGAIKHLYVISAYSGQVILYSPVRGKVTSGGKSLTPKKIEGTTDNATKPTIKVGGVDYTIADLPNEDGTYGFGSADYIYWFTPEGKFHQHFLSGGQIVHISDTPVSTKGVVINIEK
jgi:hypothetical protein